MEKSELYRNATNGIKPNNIVSMGIPELSIIELAYNPCSMTINGYTSPGRITVLGYYSGIGKLGNEDTIDYYVDKASLNKALLTNAKDKDAKNYEVTPTTINQIKLSMLEYVKVIKKEE